MGGENNKYNMMGVMGMVIVQVGYARMNVSSKMAMDSGMDPLVLIAYRQIFAALSLSPFAFFFERKARPKLTKHVLFQIFLCSFFGATLNQIFYFVGLKNTTATVACALSNILPAITFLLSVPFRLEAVRIKSKAGQAKVMGTIVCVGGAMILSFYHGHVIGLIGPSRIHWGYIDKGYNDNNVSSHKNKHGSFLMGPFLLLTSNVTMAIWFIIQAKMSESFAAPYTSSAVMSVMGSVQCSVIAMCTNHQLSAWSLHSPIRLLASLYAGVIGSGVAICIMTWAIEKKGPLYVSVFNPLLLVVVALLSWAFLHEQLYFGTAAGTVLIIMGLYAVLWGKNKENKAIMVLNPKDSTTGDHEVQEFASKEDMEMQQCPHVLD